IHSDGKAYLVLVVAEAPRPQIGSVSLKLRDIGVLLTSPRDRSASKVDRSYRVAGDIHVALRVGRNVVDRGRVAEGPDPNAVTQWGELQDQAPGGGTGAHGTAAEVPRAVEVPADDHISGRIHGQA